MHAKDDSLPVDRAHPLPPPEAEPLQPLPLWASAGEPLRTQSFPADQSISGSQDALPSSGASALEQSDQPAVGRISESNSNSPADSHAADARGTEAEPLVAASSLPLLRPSASLAVSVGEPPPRQLAYSTLLSLLVVLVLIVTIRFTVPPLVESLRYSWYHGQLRAEYEMAGQQLQNVSLNSLSDASELVSRRVGPSVVHINLMEVFETAGDSFFGTSSPHMQMVGQGSGVILDTEGHILTNQHVIEGAGRVEVALSDGRRVVAEEIGIDPLTDLAVIKIDADGLLPVEWGDSDKVVVGTPVWAVGSPFGLERTVTFGILSGKHRIDLKGTRYDSRVKGSTTYGDLMQSDVAVNPGNSGGPLVNSAGQIVGINTAIVGETYIGISFSIPSNVAKRVAADLIREGRVARGWLGVSLSDPELADATGAEPPVRGALVRQWANTGLSPAKAAGIRPGDIIVKFNDQDVSGHGALMGLVAQAEVGSTVPVEVVRDGERQTFQVHIGRRPQELNGRR